MAGLMSCVAVLIALVIAVWVIRTTLSALFGISFFRSYRNNDRFDPETLRRILEKDRGNDYVDRTLVVGDYQSRHHKNGPPADIYDER